MHITAKTEKIKRAQ